MSEYPLTDEGEKDLIRRLLNKMGFLAESFERILYNSQSRPYSDIDVMGIYKNSIIFIECMGRENPTNKLRASVTKLKNLAEEVRDVIRDIEENYPNFFNNDEFEEIRNLYRNGPIERIVVKLIIFTTRRRENLNENDIKYLSRNGIYLIDFDLYKFFEKIASIANKFSKYDLLLFLEVSPQEINEEFPPFEPIALKINDFNNISIYEFAETPEKLLKYTHTKRLYDWTQEGFQRLLDPKKIKSIRKYIKESCEARSESDALHERECYVFPNSIILASTDSKLNASSNEDHDQLYTLLIKETSFDIFILIDGQHRLYSFADDESDKIKSMAKYDKIPVTLILFKGNNNTVYTKMAQLFYDINSTYTRIKAETQIDLFSRIKPNSPEKYANDLLKYLNENSRLLKKKIRIKPFDEDYYNRKLIKKASLIKYGGLKFIFDSKNKIYKNFHSIYGHYVNNLGIENEQYKYYDFCRTTVYLYFEAVNEALKATKKNYNDIKNDTELSSYYFMFVTNIAALIRLLYYLLERNEFKEIFRERDAFKELKNKFSEKMKSIFSGIKYDKKTWEKTGYTASAWNKLFRKYKEILENKELEKNIILFIKDKGKATLDEIKTSIMKSDGKIQEIISKLIENNKLKTIIENNTEYYVLYQENGN